jgi:predicted ATPase/signal transduction histidine kinase
MLNLKGYEIHQDIYRSKLTRVSRGRRTEDGAPIVIKYPVMEYPSLGDIACLKNEYEILKDLGEKNVEHVVRVYALERLDHRTLILSEDFGGVQLKEHFAGGVGLEELLQIAVTIASALAAVHQHNIIHKDINPRNILINPRTREVKLIDFGISSRLSREHQQVRGLDRIDGTLAYMSPEQTGRINRTLDYRTDMYSLGATLYELLCGAPPFSSDDVMELLHCHIASDPPPLFERGVPRALSDIIAKLMSKMPDERYQSALGLKADLEECLRRLKTDGEISPFKLGRQDISHTFEIPQKLYGRERELSALLDTFSHVSQGSTALLLVSGYSGIGKSSLIHEVQGPMIKRKGYFAAGKYDQYNRDVPYSALAKALNGLIHQLLKEPASRVATWKTEIRRAVSQNAQVIIEVIPALELLLGPQPAVPSLAPAEALSRFNFVFEDFLSVLATEQHPLVLSLDDLQWADTPSLKLLELLLTDPRSKHLLVIAAYRDNEVDPSHASIVTINEIKKAGTLVQEIHLQPLMLGDVMALLTDALRCERDATLPLAELLLKKTGGNPFFLVQILGSLHEDGLLKLNIATGAWDWDITKISGIGITDNVIDLMTAKLQRLPEATQDVMKLAACVGSTFDLGMLSIVAERGERETAMGLWPAVREGLVVPLSESYQIFQGDDAGAEPASSAVAVRELITTMMMSERDAQAHIRYRFLHDRVQQATYALIPDAQKKVQHVKIGRLMLAIREHEHRDEDIFDVLTHLNVGRDLLTTTKERLTLAELNFRAGKKAQAAIAFTAANNHFSIALELLPEDRWTTHYDLTLSLYRDHAECEYLLGDFGRANELLTEALTHARTRMDKCIAHETQMRLFLTQAARDVKAQAVSTGLSALRLLGCEIPAESEAKAAKAASDMQKVASDLMARSIRDLEDLPRLTDPEKLLVMRLAVTLFGVAYLVGDFDLVMICICLVVRTSLDHGSSEASAFGYMMYGMLLSAGGEHRRAYEFGQLALALHARYPDAVMKPKIHNIFAHSINPYINHLDTNLPHYRATYECCLEGGDLAYGLWAVYYLLWAKLMKGDALHEIHSDSEGYIGFAERAGDSSMLLSIQCLRQTVLCLRGLTDGPASLDSGGFSEQGALEGLRDAQSLIGQCWHAMLRQIIDLTFERYPEAVRAVEVAEETLGAFIAFFSSMTHYFYSSLVLSAVYADASAEKRKEYLAILERNAAKMKHVAESGPDNYLHCYQLIEAEKARILGETTRAAELYDASVFNAQKGRFLNHEALALELAAKFYLSMGRKRLAQVYMTDAYHAYARWGAAAKVEQLREKYPDLIGLIMTDIVTGRAEAAAPAYAASTTTIAGEAHSLDLATVMKASQAVSEEIVLSKLLEKLMRIVLQHAGAQRGYLILERNHDLLIEASATMDGRDVIILKSVPITSTEDLSQEIVRYVQRTRQRVVLANAAKEGMFISDAYVMRHKPRSVLCMPVIHQGNLVGIVYLENNLTEGAFTPSRLEILRLLSSQVAISIENSRLYGHLEDKVKERTAELREAQAKLIRFEREETERRMAGGFAHEVRNALAGARLVLEKVLGSEAGEGETGMIAQTMDDLGAIYESTEERLTAEEMEPVLQSMTRIIDNQKAAKKAFQFVFEASNRALNITKRIMDYSVLEERTTSSSAMVDLSGLIQSAMSVIREEVKGHDIQVTAEMAKSINIVADSVQCYSILQNLLNNARDAILENGPASGSGTIHVEAAIADERLVLRVKDNGIGIKEENLSRIFDAFYSTKPNTGTGLGLATVKKIVEVNGGDIRVESEWKKGTTFTVLLPMTGILARDEKRSHAPALLDQAPTNGS